MEIIGFIVLMLIGLYFSVGAFIGAYVCVAFTGKPDWVHFTVFSVLGAAALYFAITNSPFHVTVG